MHPQLDPYERIGLEFEVDVYTLGLELTPGNLRLLDALSTALCRLGSYEKALKVVDELLALDSSNPRIHYNRACALCRLGLLEDALDALRSAFARGFEDIDFMRKDPDLEPLHNHEAFRHLTPKAPMQIGD